MQQELPAISARRRWTFRIILFGFMAGVALLLRLPLLRQSFWYDELYSLLNYIQGPWEQIVAGDYSPNNHVLYSLLAKASASIFGPGEAAVRLPSILAGSMVGIALAWPVLGRNPGVGLATGLLAAAQPWLIDFSTQARGYALMLLLCILATNSLPERPGHIAWRYMLIMAAAMYTVPIAILVLVAHAVTMAIWHRSALGAWAATAAGALVLTAALYWPFAEGIVHYFSGGPRASIAYGQFLSALLQHIATGQQGPAHPYISNFVFAAMALAVMLTGAWLLISQRIAVMAVTTFAVASALAILLPLALPGAGEIRFVPWLIPLHILGLAGLLVGLPRADSRERTGLPPFVFDIVRLVLVLMLVTPVPQLLATPAQPIRDGIAAARKISNGRPVVGVYMASAEAARYYGGIDAMAYKLDAADPPPDYPDLRTLEHSLPSPPVLVIFYEPLLRQANPALWNSIEARYDRAQKLPGRISPVSVFQPKPACTQPATSPTP